MKTSDIKLNGPAFSSSWWSKQAPPACQGSAIEKALDAWKGKCVDPDKLNDLDELADANSAADALDKALNAPEKAAKNDKDAKAGFKAFRNVIAAYLKDIAKIRKEFEDDEKEAGNLVNALKQAKNREMYYGLVRKGNVGRLFVSRKQNVVVRLARKAKASDLDVKGGKQYLGKCDFAEGKVRFHFEEKPPNLRPVLRSLLADANMKPAIFVNGFEFDDEGTDTAETPAVDDAKTAAFFTDWIKGLTDTIRNTHLDTSTRTEILTQLQVVQSQIDAFDRSNPADWIAAGGAYRKADELITAAVKESRMNVVDETHEAATTAFRDKWEAAIASLKKSMESIEKQLLSLADALVDTEDEELYEVASEDLPLLFRDIRMSANGVLSATANTAVRTAAAARPAIREFRSIMQDERLIACDKNDFGVSISIRSVLNETIGELESALEVGNRG